MEDVLVVGYGSELRGDDAAGRRVAAQVAARGLPGVRVASVPQLVPELVAELDGCRRVIFVDASLVDREVTERAVGPAAPPWRHTHRFEPASLLSLAAMTGTAPEAVVISVPAVACTLGAPLSATTARAVTEAVDRVVALCRGGGCAPAGR